MVKTKDGLLRLFWPATLARTTTPGVIVGWCNADLDLFVVTVLEDVDAYGVETALRTGTLFRGSPYPIESIYRLCQKSSMSVLGTFNHGDSAANVMNGQIHLCRVPNEPFPRIYSSPKSATSIQLILYDPPDPSQLQYMSLEPINLALPASPSSIHGVTAADEQSAVEDREEQKRIAALVKKLKFHTVIRHKPTQKELALTIILRQINCASELAALMQKNTPFIGPRRKRMTSVSERVVESAQSLYALAAWSLWTLFMLYAYPTLSYAFKLAVVGHRIISEALLQILEFRLPIKRVNLPDTTGASSDNLALKDISAICQQVHLRLQQFSYYPTQYLLLQQRHRTWSSIAGTNADYIRFYNSLWLVANDVIIGIALGSFITENAAATSRFLVDMLNQYTIDGLRDMIRWLMSYPGGLKLNTELAAFLGDLFLWVIEYWSTTTAFVILPYLPKIIVIIGFSSFAGASMPVAIISDLLSLLTMHIYSFYVASARIFNWQLTIISSLFHLFRGKKRNVLRNRIDSCDYDLDQLLLGTIFFTLLFFLLPTVIVFYLTFASARMAIISIKATLDTALAILNHFPLFAIMLKLKDSQRLPGGVHLQLLQTPQRLESPLDDRAESEKTPPETPVSSETPAISDTPATSENSEDDASATLEDQHQYLYRSPQTSYIRLTSIPLSMRQIFSQYFQLGGRIRKHYLSPKVVLRLLTGRFVPPLGRGEMYGMQYSVLPRQRASLSDVWKGLFEEDTPPRWKDRDTAVQNGTPDSKRMLNADARRKTR